jgi:hypothetical protein
MLHTRVREWVSFPIAVICALGAVGIYPMVARHLFDSDTSFSSTPLHINLIRFVLFSLLLTVPAAWVKWGFAHTNNWLYSHRFLIGASLVAGAVILNISGSSLGVWNAFLGKSQFQDVVFGTPRVLRSDEYAVNTPFWFAQEYNNYAQYNDIIGNRAADMYLIKDAPVWVVGELFRPFHWGFLLFGSERGLAFYWSARQVALFLASLEFFSMSTSEFPTKDNRTLALIGAMLVSFAPIIQWWYAVNGLVEMLVAAFVALVLFDKYLKTHEMMKRLAYLLIILLCAGMYLFTFYPAWQVPLAFVIMIFVVWEISRSWGNIRMTLGDTLLAVCGTLIFALIAGYTLVQSLPTIKATMSTVYPGHRVSQGGGFPFSRLLSTPLSLFFSNNYFGSSYESVTNATEASQFVDLFPLGIVLAIVCMVFRKKVNKLNLTLIFFEIFFVVYMRFGFPKWLAVLSLLSWSTSGRVVVAAGTINILLLIRAAAEFRSIEVKSPRLLGGAITATISIIVVISSLRVYPSYAGTAVLCSVFIATAVMTYALVGVGRAHSLVSTITVIGLLGAGMWVNPIQYGSRPLTAQPLVKQAQAIDYADGSGLWITDGADSSKMAQLLVANGIRTSNALAVTPNSKMWKVLDPSGKYKESYNRYAFISVDIESSTSKSQLVQVDAPDAITLHLNAEQLLSLGITHVLSTKDLAKIGIDGGSSFNQVGKQIDGHYVFALVQLEK